MDRKTFVKNTTLLGTATAVLPKFSFAQVKGSDKLKIAIVGCGSRGIFDTTMMIKADKISRLLQSRTFLKKTLLALKMQSSKKQIKLRVDFLINFGKLATEDLQGLKQSIKSYRPTLISSH